MLYEAYLHAVVW